MERKGTASETANGPSTDSVPEQGKLPFDEVIICGQTEIPFVRAAFGPQNPEPIDAAVVRSAPYTADSSITNDVRGRIALILRGNVPFVDKARRAMHAGAIAVIFVNTIEELYVPLPYDDQGSDVTIPSVCIRRSDEAHLADSVKISIAYNASHQAPKVVENLMSVLNCLPSSAVVQVPSASELGYSVTQGTLLSEIGDVTKSWVIPGVEVHTRLQLRHNTVHGKYSVLTNGRVLAEGRQSLLFTKPEGGAISLELLGRKAVIRIMANKMLLKFHYSCVVDGYHVAEEQSKRQSTIVSEACIPPVTRVCIEKHEKVDGAAGMGEVYYHIVSVWDGNEGTVIQTYAEFLQLDKQLRSAFKGNHMLSSLPALPDRKYLGETHLAPYLIDDRQQALENYLRRLLGVPSVPSNADLLAFLGHKV